jgi:hypothetical protein
LEIRDLCYSSKVILLIKLRKDAGGGESGIHGKEEKFMQGYCEETLGKETTWNS